MRIAQFSPFLEPIPPPVSEGIELRAKHFTYESFSGGHEAILFASGDSQTLAKLEAIFSHALPDGEWL